MLAISKASANGSGERWHSEQKFIVMMSSQSDKLALI
jgi:hypothetical protein